MKRTRKVVKTYVENSDDSDDSPLQKPLTDKKKLPPNTSNTDHGYSSSSGESDIEKYLHKPEKLDLNSDFFNQSAGKAEKPEDKAPPKNLSLSDSESSSEDESTKPKTQTNQPISQEQGEEPKQEDEAPGPLYLFSQFQNYTKQIEETKRQVEMLKAKKTVKEKNVNISEMLAAGEKIEGLTADDLHSSDFESHDSEQEDWEVIKNKGSQESQEKNIVPTKGLEIVVDMPNNVKKKKGIDLVAALKRRLNRIRKENQVLVHKVHLLCWIVHGNYINSAINDTQTMAMALSLLPSDQCYPSDRIDLSYLEQITAWYKITIKLLNKPAQTELPLVQSLQAQIAKKEAYNKKMLAIIFVTILRALGIQARVVMSLQVEPLRPPASELLGMKEDINVPSTSKKENVKIEVQKPTPKKKCEGLAKPQRRRVSKSESNATELGKLEKKPRAKSSESTTALKPLGSELKNGASTSKKQLVNRKVDVKIALQPPTPPKKSKPEAKRQKDVESVLNAKTSASKNADKLKPVGNTRKRSNSTDEPAKSSESLPKKPTKKLTVKVQGLTGRGRSTSTESIVSVEMEIPAKRAKSAENVIPTKRTTRKRVPSTESNDSNAPAAPKKRTRARKKIPQLDGLHDSDSDYEMILLQVDGANDEPKKKQAAKSKKSPNLKVLRKPTGSSAKPNLKSLTAPRKDQLSDSDSDFEPAGGSPFKKQLEKAAPDLKKLKKIKAGKNDVTKDIVHLVKKRISEQKRTDRSKLANKQRDASDSDSDYLPEATTSLKKQPRDSDDDFRPKTKVKRRIPVRPVLSDDEGEKKKKIGNDVWVEVFLEAEEKWISVDVVFGQVHCVKEISQRATHPITYVLSWDNNNHIKDISLRYCQNFNTVTRKLRIDQKWWTQSLKPYVGKSTARDKEEDEDLARQQLDQPLPKSIAEYKNHPLYALKRHLLKFEAIYPPEPVTLGFIRGEAVYPRGCVFTLHSRDIWLKQAKVVRRGEEPYKIVKARPKWDKLSNKSITDQMLEIFGPWQVEDYDPPTAENGIVPRNAYGNVDLFKACMLPKGCVHLHLPGLGKVAKRLNIDCTTAVIGFDFHNGGSVPVLDGFVVCKEFEEQLISAWEVEQEELQKKEKDKIEKRVYGNWKKLIKGLLISERLKARYDFGNPSSSTDKPKKVKAPTFCTKKK